MTKQQKVGILGITMCAVLAFLISQYGGMLVVGGLILMVLLVVVFAFPEVGTIVVIFVLYTNLAVVAKNIHGVPHSLASSFGLLLVIPLASHLIIKRERLVIDNAFILMLVFFSVQAASSLFAVNVDVALDWILNYSVEGLALFFLIINVVRNPATLRRVIWTLILAGSLLGSLALYQEITGSYDNHFGGLAQRGVKEEPIGGSVTALEGDMEPEIRRAGGPVDGNPNRFAQIMVVLLPLAIFRIWSERSLGMRAAAMAASMLILSGILLTYSRAGMVTLVLLILIMIFMRYIRLHQILIALAVIILFISTATPGVFSRFDTLRGVEGLFSAEAEQRPDGSTRSRATEMLAALNVFLDYPVLGVGIGQYSKYYSIDYHLDPDIAFRYIPTTRRAHSLYLELAAETGVVGLATFLAIVLLILHRLWRVRHQLKQSHPESASTATAFMLAIVGYLGTAMFASLAYQRYYWFLLALAGAAIQILNAKAQSRVDMQVTQAEKQKAYIQSVA